MDGYGEYVEEDLHLEEIETGEVTPNEAQEFSEEIFEKSIIEDEPSSLLDELLKVKGIKDSKVFITGENDEVNEVSFYELSREEQLDILNNQEQLNESADDNDLDESEIDLLNHLRTNNLSVDQFLTQYKDAILAEAQISTEPTYEIDAYDDQELFLLDLKQKYDLTDEELQTELEKELANTDLFTKKITKLRAEYKELEAQYNASQQAEAEAQREEQYNQFANTMVDIATNIPDFHGVFLEDNEKTETLSYLLDLDDGGVSQFSKDLNDPQKLYEAAWYLRYGAEAFKALEDAYEAEIAKLKKVDKPRVVVRNSDKPIKNINDLF